MQLDTYNLDGQKVGSVEIQDKLIQEEYSLRILQEAIVAYRNETRRRHLRLSGRGRAADL